MRYLEIELRHHEANLIHFSVMSNLYKNGGEMTPSEISESVFREKNSITAVINTLEKQGVVRRVPSTDDHRSVKVVITDKGWQKANRLNPIVQGLSREALSSLEQEKLEELVETMRVLRENLLPRIVKNPGKAEASRKSQKIQ